jgi:hypothetical protein
MAINALACFAAGLGPASLYDRSPEHPQREDRLRIGASAYAEFPVAFGERTEDRRIANGTAKSSLPDGGMDAAPSVGLRPNFELRAVQVGVGKDDGRPHPCSNIDDHCALTRARGLLGFGVGVMVLQGPRHEATLGALYPWWGRPK